MEQVFELVNVVLRKDKDASKRSLRLRTYKVVPLSAQSGILEFVTETMPLDAWLINAHAKYALSRIRLVSCFSHPRRYAPATGGPYKVWSAIRTAINKEKNNGDERRIAVFKDICRAWKPVMRHYFTERHKEPMPWFKMRLNYARSVATTSIVGHIIGLGDRHLSNILLHTDSGEVVHIDLGIAFEQVSPGKALLRSQMTIRVSGEASSDTGDCPIPPHKRHG